MESSFIERLPGGFHETISCPVKTMADLNGRKPKGEKPKPFLDLEATFFKLILSGQQQDIQMPDLFSYELAPIPPSMIDSAGRLRTGNKATLTERLSVNSSNSQSPDVIIVDASQIMYHIVWPHEGQPADLVKSIETRLSAYPQFSDKILVFDKHSTSSAKNHERARRTGNKILEYDLTLNSHLPTRSEIMNNTENKIKLASILGAFNYKNNISTDYAGHSGYTHEEADVTIISRVIEYSRTHASTIRVLTNDTDVFVLLVYFVLKHDIQCSIEMEKWDGKILDINASAKKIGGKALQLPAMHALTGCDTTPYLFRQGKVAALNLLLKGNFQELERLGKVDLTDEQLLSACMPFVLALYGQPDKTIEAARFSIFNS